MKELFPLVIKQESGFTLVELLFVLTIVAVLLVLVIPSMIHALDEMETKQFFKELDSDVFYVQSNSLGRSDYFRIVFEPNNYRIIDPQANTVKKRDYPANLQHYNIRNYSFSNSGTVRNPNSSMLSNDHAKYQIVFPLGKGRHYIEKK